MFKFIDTKCEMCGTPLLHVPSNRRFCSECGKIRHREKSRIRRQQARAIKDSHTDPLWRAQTVKISSKERYRNKLQRLADDYRYGARHSVNVAVIRQIKAVGKKLGYAKERIVADIEKAKQEAEQGVKCYHATPEEIKEMLGE